MEALKQLITLFKKSDLMKDFLQANVYNLNIKHELDAYMTCLSALSIPNKMYLELLTIPSNSLSKKQLTCLTKFTNITMVEASDTPILLLVLPLPEELKQNIGLILNEILEGSSFVSSYEQDKKLATATIATLIKIKVHDLSSSSSLLNRGLRTLSFIRDTFTLSNICMNGQLFSVTFLKTLKKSTVKTWKYYYYMRGDTLGEKPFGLLSCM